MALAMDQIKRGTQVAIAFDDDGRKLPIQRRGVIVKIETVKRWGKNADGQSVAVETEVNGNVRAGVAKIWVALKDGEPPVEVKNSWLALIREGRRGDWLKLQAQMDAEKAAEIEAGTRIPEPGEAPVVVDETKLENAGKPISEAELNRLTQE